MCTIVLSASRLIFQVHDISRIADEKYILCILVSIYTCIYRNIVMYKRREAEIEREIKR